MRWLSRLRSLVRTLFRQSRLDQDLDVELEGYVSSLAARHADAGLSPDEARRAALRECEGIEQTKDRVRDVRVGAGLELALLDLRHAFRGLRRNPGVAATAILTLALGIGATLAIFSVVRAVLLRPLPYANPEQVVFIWNTTPDGETTSISPARLTDVRKRDAGFAGVAGVGQVPMNLLEGSRPERLLAASVSTNFFEVLGTKPRLGRTFAVGREQQQVVVLGHGLWTRRFGADPSIVGRELTFDSGKRTVIGIMPADFLWRVVGGDGYRGPQPELWVPAPLGEVPAAPGGLVVPDLVESRSIVYIRAVARLKPGRSPSEVNRSLATLAAQLAKQYPDTDKGLGFRVVPATEQLVGGARVPLQLLLGAVILVLGVACVNVANLLLVRALARRGEIGVRLALGAGRLRLARQFLVEGLVISTLGAGLGLLLAHSTLAALVALSPSDIARLGETRVDWVVFLVAAGIAVATALAVSVAPMLDAGRVSTLVQEASLRASRRHVTQRLLLVGEIAMAAMLVVGAGLLIRSLGALQQVDVGIRNPQQILTFGVAFGGNLADDSDRQLAFYAGLLDRIGRLPGVRSAGAVVTLPLGGDDIQNAVWVEGEPAPKPSEADGLQTITPGYFRTIGVPLVAGRDITPADRDKAPRVVVVNEAFARHHFAGTSAVGRRLRMSTNPKAAFWTIVGVARDVRHFGPSRPARSEVFLPVAQAAFPFMSFVVRTDGDPLALAPAVRAAAVAVDPTLPLADMQTLQTYLNGSLAQARFLARLLSTFGALALLLAAVGIYGVMSWSVIERKREIGVRVAVGASPLAIAAMVGRQGGVMLAAGLGVGAAAAAGLGRVLRGLLFDVRPEDPLTYASTMLVLAAVSVVALWLPAYRASRVDAVTTLRE